MDYQSSNTAPPDVPSVVSSSFPSVERAVDGPSHSVPKQNNSVARVLMVANAVRKNEADDEMKEESSTKRLRGPDAEEDHRPKTIRFAEQVVTETHDLPFFKRSWYSEKRFDHNMKVLDDYEAKLGVRLYRSGRADLPAARPAAQRQARFADQPVSATFEVPREMDDRKARNLKGSYRRLEALIKENKNIRCQLYDKHGRKDGKAIHCHDNDAQFSSYLRPLAVEVHPAEVTPTVTTSTTTTDAVSSSEEEATTKTFPTLSSEDADEQEPSPVEPVLSAPTLDEEPAILEPARSAPQQQTMDRGDDSSFPMSNDVDDAPDEEPAILEPVRSAPQQQTMDRGDDSSFPMSNDVDDAPDEEPAILEPVRSAPQQQTNHRRSRQSSGPQTLRRSARLSSGGSPSSLGTIYVRKSERLKKKPCVSYKGTRI